MALKQSIRTQRIGSELLDAAAKKAARRMREGWNDNEPGDFGLTLRQWAGTLQELQGLRRGRREALAVGMALGFVVWALVMSIAGWL